MQQGDYVMVESGVLHAVGRYACGAAMLLGGPPPTGIAALDVCLLGTHLPQMYQEDQCTPIADVDVASHGFCVTCKGWGLIEMFDYAQSVDQVLDGKAGVGCTDCGGSGRKGITVTVERTPEALEGTTSIAADAGDGVTCELCAAAYVVT